MMLVQHCINNRVTFTCLLRQYCVVGLHSVSVRAKRVPLAHSASQRCHRIASFLRLVLTQNSGTCYFEINATLYRSKVRIHDMLTCQCVSDFMTRLSCPEPQDCPPGHISDGDESRAQNSQASFELPTHLCRNPGRLICFCSHSISPKSVI